jgi:hypothetical protein
MLRFFMMKALLIVSFLFCIASAGYADIYKYTDEKGVVCYTDAPLGKKSEKVMKEKSVGEEAPAVPFSGSVDDYGSYVIRAATKYEIEPELIHAVIKTESNGNERAVSRKGAIGLMQLMPSTAMDMDVSDPFNPEENIEGGAKYLKYLLERFKGDLTLALAAYNAGPTTVEKYGSVPPISETRQYVKKVFSLYSGKKSYTVPDHAKHEAPAPPVKIYKVVLEDGTTLFTNTPLARTGKVRF